MDEPERPVTHETTVINTGERRGGGGTAIAIVLVLIVATLGFLYFGGYLQRAADKADVNINVVAEDRHARHQHRTRRGASRRPATARNEPVLGRAGAAQGHAGGQARRGRV